jgi:hypothetical protein
MENKVYTQDELRALLSFADGRKIMATAERRNCNGTVLTSNESVRTDSLVRGFPETLWRRQSNE